MKTALIFDFDGTLINTNRLIETGLNYFACQTLGRFLTHEEHLSLLGRPLNEQMRFLDANQEVALTEAFRVWYLEAHESHVVLFEGVRELLDMLKQYGYPMAIVSNNSRETIQFGLNQFDMASLFSVVISCDDVQEKKPNPEGLYQAMAALDVTAEECLFIGDSANDLLAAKAAGVEDVLVAWTAGDEQALRALSPNYVIERPLELLQVMGIFEGNRAS